MGDYMHGQPSLQFKEVSQELMHATHSNKGSQDTRWVRANLRAYQSFCRNLPTLYVLVGREESTHSYDGNNTQQKVAEKRRKEISDGSTFASAVGIMQLLDSYPDTSLNAQHLKFFPTTVMKSVVNLGSKLKSWENDWEWSEQLKFASY